MLTAETLKAYVASLSIPACGICSGEKDAELFAILKARREGFSFCDFEEADLEKRCNPALLMPGAKSVLVCLFPYFRADLVPENISRYAAVPDYHKVVGQYLERIADFIRKEVPKANILPLCDTSPLTDRWLAYKAGLGFFGKNHLLIHPAFGSWFFIGSLLLDIPLETDTPLAGSCADCGACIKACPGGALSEGFGFDCEKCISYITQKREIDAGQKLLLAGQDSVYGCDVCQTVCPHNRGIKPLPMADFCEGELSRLDKVKLETMRGRDFRRTYENYAFSWCSKKTIEKNFT